MGAKQVPERQAKEGMMAKCPQVLTGTDSLLDKTPRLGRASSPYKNGMSDP